MPNLKFIPPVEEAQGYPRYGSYVVGSGLKLHGRLGDAKNSWRNRGWHYVETGNLTERYDGKMVPERAHRTKHAFILENVKGEWFTLYEIAPGLTEKELPWMKEYYRDSKYSWDRWTLVSDTFTKDGYYKKLREQEPERFVFTHRAAPMTTDEYVSWRIAVELERRGLNGTD